MRRRENINYVKNREFCVRCNFFFKIASCLLKMKRGSNWVPSSFHLINCSLNKAEKREFQVICCIQSVKNRVEIIYRIRYVITIIGRSCCASFFLHHPYMQYENSFHHHTVMIPQSEGLKQKMGTLSDGSKLGQGAKDSQQSVKASKFK